jgi:hypothetical protein
MYVPALLTVIVHVAVPAALSVVVDVPQPVTPAVPLTDQDTVPVGVVPPLGPETVAVKVTPLPSVVGVELATTSVGVTLATVKLLELTAAVTPLMLPGVAVKVYVPAVLIKRFENVATPLLSVTAVVAPGAKEVWVLPLLIVSVTDPLAVVTRLP